MEGYGSRNSGEVIHVFREPLQSSYHTSLSPTPIAYPILKTLNKPQPSFLPLKYTSDNTLKYFLLAKAFKILFLLYKYYYFLCIVYLFHKKCHLCAFGKTQQSHTITLNSTVHYIYDILFIW